MCRILFTPLQRRAFLAIDLTYDCMWKQRSVMTTCDEVALINQPWSLDVGQRPDNSLIGNLQAYTQNVIITSAMYFK